MCSFVSSFLSNWIIVMATCGVFSLEEDDCNELFITQSARELILDGVQMSQDSEKITIFGINGDDFKSKTPMLINPRGNAAMYEDISDDEGQFECSQNVPNFK